MKWGIWLGDHQKSVTGHTSRVYTTIKAGKEEATCRPKGILPLVLGPFSIPCERPTPHPGGLLRCSKDRITPPPPRGPPATLNAKGPDSAG